MSCGVGCRQGLDPELLWLWRRPAATAPIRPLAWELPFTAGAAQKMAKRKKKKEKKFLCGEEGRHFETVNISFLEFLSWLSDNESSYYP